MTLDIAVRSEVVGVANELPPSPGRGGAIVRIAFLCLLGLLGGLLVVYWAYTPKGGIKVVIYNKTGAKVDSVRIEFTGGAKTVPSIHPGGVFRTKIRPASESHLQLTYKEVTGKQHSDLIGVYFEPGYRGAVFIELLPNGALRFEDNICLPYSY